LVAVVVGFFMGYGDLRNLLFIGLRLGFGVERGW
jgi:hypothetical protein